jgi:protein-S-isoprenylcysteine O-methyltransferase Ste14
VTPLASHLVYALAWASFGLVHSLLARPSAKARLRPLLGPWYRLAYNGLATVHVAVVWAVGWSALAGAGALGLPPWTRGLLMAVEIAGWLLMAVALTGYDLGRLGGLAQIRHHRRGIALPEDEPLRTDGLHRFVRHPVYTAGFLILWGRIGDEFDLATAVWGSLYLAIGAVFEERWLLVHYGAAYAAYRRRVPAFVPWKGRAV